MSSSQVTLLLPFGLKASNLKVLQWQRACNRFITYEPKWDGGVLLKQFKHCSWDSILQKVYQITFRMLLMINPRTVNLTILHENHETLLSKLEKRSDFACVLAVLIAFGKRVQTLILFNYLKSFSKLFRSFTQNQNHFVRLWFLWIQKREFSWWTYEKKITGKK